MAAEDVFQRPVDANQQTLQNLPAPAAVGAKAAVRNEVELVDTIIRRIRESSGPTDMLVGAVADGALLRRSGTAIVGAAAGSVQNKISISEESQKEVVGNVESIVEEWVVNLDDCGAVGPETIKFRISAAINRGAIAGTATYRLYYGATVPGSLGGAINAFGGDALTTVSATDVAASALSPAIANPGGPTIIQLTALHSVAVTGVAQVRGVGISIG